MSTIGADIFFLMNRFILSGFLFALTLGMFFSPPVFASTESTLTVSFEKQEDTPGVLKQGETLRIGKLDFVADGGKIDVERITVDIEGTIDPDDILRAKLYTEWDTYIGAADIQEDNITFSQLKDFSVNDGEKKSLLFEVEMSQNAEIGKTAGFRLKNEQAVYVLSEKYDKRYIELEGDAEIDPIIVLDDASDTLLLASMIPEPEYKTSIQAGEGTTFGTFRFEAFGESDVIIEEISFRKTGSVSDSKIQNIKLTQNGNVIADEPDFSSQRILLSEPITIKKNTSMELDIEFNIASSAKTGEDLFLEISNPWDIVGISKNSDEEIAIHGDFPIRTNTKAVASSGVRLRVSPENPQARRVTPQEKDIVLLEFTLESMVDDIDFDGFTVNIIGDEKSITNLRLKKTGGTSQILGILSGNDTVIFSPNISQQAGQKISYVLLADAASNIVGESYVSLVSPNSSYASVDDIEILGDFPITGNTVTIGEKPEANSAKVSLRREAETLFENLPDAILCSVRFESEDENAEIRRMILKTDADEGVLQNVRLVDKYGNIVALPSAISSDTLLFTDSFPAPKENAVRYYLTADIGSIPQDEEISVSLDSPPEIFGLESKEELSVVGNFPISAEGIDIEQMPEEAFVGYSVRLLPGVSVERNTADLIWGKIDLTAYQKDIRIDRMLLLKGGEQENGITNIRLQEEGTQRKYTGDIADSSYIFDDEIRLEANKTKTMLLMGDIRQVAPMGEEFWFSIAGPDQFLASANGKEMSVIGHKPQQSSIFSIADIASECSVIPDEVCGRSYQYCSDASCESKDTWYTNSCALKQDNAIKVHDSYCSGSKETKESSAEQTESPNDTVAEQEDETPTDAPEVSDFFMDVSSDHPNEQAIRALKNESIVQGFEDGNFRPENEISRAAFTKIVIGAVFTENEIKNCLSEHVGNSEQTAFFPDVPVQEWFAPYVCIAKTEGIINGFPNGTFKPEKNISFAEAAKIVGISYGAKGDENETWYAPFVRFLSEKNSIPVSISHLEENITRGEMSEIMYRIMEGVMEKASRTADAFL